MLRRTPSLFKPFPILETERLILRRLQQTDLRDVFEYASNENISRQVLWDAHQSLRESQRFLDYTFERYRRGEMAPFAIEHKTDRKMIGTIDFAWWERGNGTVEIGFALSEKYWGLGLIPEAARAMQQFAFEKMGVTRIEARCFAENSQSIRVLEKMGMTYEGTLRQRLLVKGERRNVHMYSILHQEWKQQEQLY